ncbi:Urea carboxylase-related aminomethyltransferase [Mycolicibacterium wolinskyi]|uniref:Urea carboxylase-related aminomethyltransferase n=1 Tax=Mycolicibacterium wolinskyi TaxID=59750 RepID=A0A132PSY9_9MYCO|nr:urea carboxylase-associated family protein [Mycolicibacterium wolinskyi]KWX25443.1 Urea carboxylase-related aminomethyltransferase [Mycolicibacterium wolinskyi]
MKLRSTTGYLEVPAGAGRAVQICRGDRLQVIDVDGGQVGDLFAFATADVGEYLSASHTRTATGSLFPQIGDQFVTNRRRPILTLAEDTSPGTHDMLIAACDPERYRKLGVDDHNSCAANLQAALAELGLVTDVVPQPVNLFMNIPVSAEGTLSWLPAVSRSGDSVTLEAEMDCVVVVSACPMDLNPINGDRPTPLALRITTPHIDTEEIRAWPTHTRH